MKSIAGKTLLVGVLLVSILWANHALAAKFYKEPYLIYNNLSTKMRVAMETDNGVDDDDNHIRIEFDESGPKWIRERIDMDVGSGYQNRRLYTFVIHNLKPNKKYHFTVKARDWSISSWTEHSGTFWTPPDEAENIKSLEFYAMGDSRSYSEDGNKDIAKVVNAIHAHKGRRTFVIHTGDIVPWGATPGQWGKRWFDIDAVKQMMAQMPMLTTMGNHDIEGDDGWPPTYYYGNYFHYPMYWSSIGKSHPTKTESLPLH